MPGSTLRHFRLARLPLLISVALMCSAARSGDYLWQGGGDGSSFLDGSNWDQGTVPGAMGMDDAFSVSTDGASPLITLDDDVDISTGSGLVEDVDSLSLATLEHQSGVLSIGTLEIGRDGFGEYRLAGPDAWLNVGHLALGVNEGSEGTFTNDGGQINVFGETTLIVGDAGTGTFNQTSGTTNDTSLILGNQVTGDGTVNLSGGTISITGDAIVGNAGEGYFYHDNLDDSAAVAVGGRLILGAQTDSYGEYDLLQSESGRDSTLITNGTVVGQSGVGMFVQDGGLHQVGSIVQAADLVLGENASGEGTYIMNGGALVAEDNGSRIFVGFDGHGEFTLNDGSVSTADLHVGGWYDFGTNTGHYGTGVFTQNGGDVTTGGLYLDNGPDSEYNLNGGTLTSGFGSLGGGDSGAVFNQSGGTNTNTGLFIVGNGGAGPSAIYTIDGATAAANFHDLWVGGFGYGEMNQSDGDVNVSHEMRVGDGPEVPNPADRSGNYFLSGGTLDNAGRLIVGVGNGVGVNPGSPDEPGGLGFFEQNGGVHTIAGNLILGQSGNATNSGFPPTPLAGGTGTYELSAGTLHVKGDTFIGGSGLPDGLQDGTGTFVHTGGTHTTDGDMTVGLGNGTGSYELSGTGVLNTGITYLWAPTSTFQQDGGTHNTSYLNIYGGEYNLSSGTIEVAGNMGVGHVFNSASFNQTGGDVAVNDGTFGLSVGGNAGTATTGTYTLDAGTLTVAATTHVGSDGVGTFNQSGGVHTTGHLLVGKNTVGMGNGTYNLNGGTLVASGTIQVKPNADPDTSTGILSVAGGALTAPLIINQDQLNYSAGSITATIDNSGDFNVSGGGIRTLAGTLNNNAGGVLAVAAETPLLVITGALTNAATGQIQAGANITVGTDYNNLAAGSGNAFNHRANVTGAGQILAAGDVEQAITGAVTGGTTVTPVLNFGNVRVGADVTQNYQIANAGTTGPDLRGAIQTSVNGGNITDARLTGSGVTAGNFGPIGIGANSGNLAVNFNASSAGALTGQAVHIANNFDNVQDQTIEIAGAAFNAAVGNATPSPTVNLGNARIDAAQFGTNFNVTNMATAGVFSEDLNASFGGSTGAVSNNGGTISGLVAGSSNGSAMGAFLDTATAGAKSGTVTLNYQTAGTVNGVSNGLGTASAGSQDITVSGNVYRLAQGSASPDPISFGNVHLNDAVSQSLTVSNTAANDDFSEGLGVSASDTGAATISGSVAGLIAAGSSDNGLSVALDTSVAGNRSGTVELAYTSDGTGTSGLAAIGAGSQSVEVSGAVYRLASAQINNAGSFSFGNVHVGDTLSQAISISNTAVADAFSESLNASFGAISDNRITTNGGAINQLAAGGTDSSGMVVNVATTAAGSVNGTVTLNFASDGTGTSGLGVTGLPSQDLAVTASISATAYRLANPVINNTQPIAFGNFREGDSVAAQAVSITNDVPNDGLSEALNAAANGTTGGVLANGGSFSLLAPQGTNSSAITVSIDTATAGNKSGAATIDFASDGTGSSGLGITSLASQDVQVTGAVYRLAAAGAHSPEPVDLGNIRVGGSFGTLALTMQNTAANDGFSESLDADFTGTTGGASASGSIDNLAAQASDSTSLVVGLGNADTSTAGARSGTATIGLESDGSGTSGIAGNVALGTQTVNVTGNVYRLAQGSASPDPVNFGNVHLNDAVSQSLTVSNTAANDGFSEGLNASFGATSGDANNNGGAVNVLAAGGADASAMAVGIDTGSAGAKTGTVVVNYASDGTGTSGLAAIGAGSQSVEVSGAVYRLASAQINNAGSFSFGNVHVGDAVSQALSITNNVASDGFSEALDASFGGSSDARISTTGSIGLLGAGSTDTTGMVIGVNTAAAGNVSGTATVLFASNGAGTSGLGITSLPSQDVVVSAAVVEGAVFRLADPVINNAQPIAFGNVRQGATVTAQALSITNAAPDDGFSESLNASAGGTTGGVLTNGGSFNLLAAQATNDTAVTVSMDSGSAGNKSGVATIDFVSDGAGTSDLGQTLLASQNVQVTGAVYRLADPLLDTTSVTLAARVGDALPSASVSVTNSSPDAFTEGLDAAFGAAPAGFTATGSVTNLAAGATDGSSLSVGLTSTASSQNLSSSVAVEFESTGAGTTGEADVSVGSALVSLAGKVYQQAVALVQQVVDFGIVHVGEVLAALGVSVTNDAPVVALNDTLTGSIGGASGPFTAAGNLGTGLLAAETDTSSLGVGLDTSAAGIFAGTAAASLFSHNPDMADLALGNFQVDLMAQVNNYANADLGKTGGDGSFGGGGLEYFLDFGNVLLNSGPLVASLEVRNAVSGPADLLDGLFNILGTQDFVYNAFNAFTNLAGGSALGGLTVSFDPTGLGALSDDIVLVSAGHNGSGYRAGLDDITLRVRANVVSEGSVPEPGSLALMAIALAGMLFARHGARVR